jgi:hypothetical protein
MPMVGWPGYEWVTLYIVDTKSVAFGRSDG